MIHCLSYDVFNKNIDMNFLNNVEVIKQYRQSVLNSKNVHFWFCNTKVSEVKGNDNGYSIWGNPEFPYDSYYLWFIS